MVDLEARKLLAQLLRNLASGRITEKQFDLSVESLPAGGQDFALAEIASRSLSLQQMPRREVARWILFLQSGQEYEWPLNEQDTNTYPMLANVVLMIIMGAALGSFKAGFWATIMLSLPLIGYRAWQDYSKQMAGATSVWPFYRLEDAERAAQHPRLLNGGR